MDYNHYWLHRNPGYMAPAGFTGLCCRAGCTRPHTQVLDGVQECEASHRHWTKKMVQLMRENT